LFLHVFCSAHSPPITQLLVSSDAQRTLRVLRAIYGAWSQRPPRGVTVLQSGAVKPARPSRKNGAATTPSHACRFALRGCTFPPPDVALGSHERGDVDQALWLYFLENFRRNPHNLVQVKQRWDPEDYFHHAQSIPVR
jgi:hypothetical protein